MAISDSTGTVQEQRQFGAWGKVDKFLDAAGSTSFTHNSLIGRGYTGHEHFFEVDLIHMNGRMYDANLGRFLSPDNYIQDPFNTQSFNRYGYVWNNPLSNVDPSGEIIGFLIAAAVFAIGNTVAHAIRGDINSFGDALKYFAQGAIAGAGVAVAAVFISSVPVLGTALKIGAGLKAASTTASIVSGIGHGIFSGDWSRLGNAAEILVGDFYLDENKSFFGGVWEGISRHTWQAPQNAVGSFYSQFNNTIGKVDRVDYFGGATFVTNENSEYRRGISTGNYINIDMRTSIQGEFDNFILNDGLFMHEYGHYIQSQIFGLSYLFAVGIPSLHSSATSSGNEHNFRWYERQANRYASRYFRRNYGVNWNNNFINDYPL